VLIIAAWLGFLAALVLWECPSAPHGRQRSDGGLANVAAAGALFWLCARASRDLTFPATRRELRPARLELV